MPIKDKASKAKRKPKGVIAASKAAESPSGVNNRTTFYVAGNAVILTYRETMVLDHLRELARETEPVRAVNKNAMPYPSLELLNMLEHIGAVDRFNTSVERGRPPVVYQLNEAGRQLLSQFEAFAVGQLESNPHKCRELIRFWQAYEPNRLIAYYANLLMGNPEKAGLLEADASLGIFPNLVPIKDDPDSEVFLLDPTAKACGDMLDLVGVGLAPSEYMPMPNPHSANEQGGGAFSIRLTGWDAHNRAIIADYLGTDSPTYLIQWLMQVGAFVALRQLHNEKV